MNRATAAGALVPDCSCVFFVATAARGPGRLSDGRASERVGVARRRRRRRDVWAPRSDGISVASVTNRNRALAPHQPRGRSDLAQLTRSKHVQGRMVRPRPLPRPVRRSQTPRWSCDRNGKWKMFTPLVSMAALRQRQPPAPRRLPQAHGKGRGQEEGGARVRGERGGGGRGVERVAKKRGGTPPHLTMPPPLQMDATMRHPTTRLALHCALAVVCVLVAAAGLGTQGANSGVCAGHGHRPRPLPLLVAPLAVLPSTTPRAVVLSLALLPAATADATENCVVCGSEPDTRCPCSGCDSGSQVDCSSKGIKSLSSEKIALPEGKTTLCVGRLPGFIPAFLSHFRLLLRIIVIVVIIIIIIIIIRRGWLRLRVCGSWWLVACLASE